MPLIIAGGFSGKLYLEPNNPLTSNGKTDGWIGLMDANGNFKKSVSYGENSYDNFVNLKFNKDGKIIFGFYVDSTITIPVKGKSTVFNAVGNSGFIFGEMNTNFEFERVWEFHSTKDVYPEQFVTDNDDNYYFSGYLEGSINFNLNNTGSKNYSVMHGADGFVAKYSKNGDLIWVNTYPCDAYGGTSTIEIKDKYLYLNAYYVGGIEIINGNNGVKYHEPSGLVLLKLNKDDGTLVWNINFAFSNYYYTYLNKIFLASNNNIITIGTFGGYAFDCDPGPSEKIIKPIQEGYYAVFLASFTETHITDVSNHKAGSALNVYQQKDYSIIKIESKKNIQNVQLFNIAGQLVFTFKNVNSNQIEIAHKDFQPGIYVLKVDQEKESKSIKFCLAE